MANPATLLLELLRRWDTRRGTNTANGARSINNGMREHVRAVGYLHEIAQILDTLEHSGRSVGAFRRRYDSWVHAVFAYPKGWDAAYPPFDHGDMDVLETLADTLDHVLTKADPEKVARIPELLGQIIEWLPGSGLPDDLKAHVYTVVSHCRQCVEEYDILGDFALQAAVDRLITVVNRAAEASASQSAGKEEPGWWTNFKSSFVYPFAVGVSANGMANQLIHEGFKALGGG